MTNSLAGRLFHRVCFQDTNRDFDVDSELAWRMESADRFFTRLPGWLELEGKSVLDVGCGAGSTCLKAARIGARRTLGVDIQPTEFATARLAGEFSDISDRCEFRQLDDLAELAPEKFDVVISQDSFEHYDDPEAFANELVAPLAPGGVAAIGFGPLWRSPYGGHLDFMTRLPWAHLIFSEQVVLKERLRFRPDESPRCYEEIRGGLNRMTLKRFERIMASTGLERLYFDTNRGDHRAMGVFRTLARIPGLTELFTANVYSVWRRPVDA